MFLFKQSINNNNKIFLIQNSQDMFKNIQKREFTRFNKTKYIIHFD